MTQVETPADRGTTDIQATLVGILENMTQDWDLELDAAIGSDTRLMEDLAFESIDVVQLAVSIEQAFGTKGLPFENLFMRDGEYVDDLRVGDVVAFLETNLPA